LDDEDLFEELRFTSDRRMEEAKAALPRERLLSLARLDPGDEAEARHRRWVEYLEHRVPMLLCVAAGLEMSNGLAEVEPSYEQRLLALDVLSECGVGVQEAGEPPTVRFTISTRPRKVTWTANANEVLSALMAKLEVEIRSFYGLSLRQARYRWRATLRQSYVRREVRLGLASPTLTDLLVEARECGRIAMGKRATPRADSL
jgi:hypothetical protein